MVMGPPHWGQVQTEVGGEAVEGASPFAGLDGRAQDEVVVRRAAASFKRPFHAGIHMAATCGETSEYGVSVYREAESDFSTGDRAQFAVS